MIKKHADDVTKPPLLVSMVWLGVFVGERRRDGWRESKRERNLKRKREKEGEKDGEKDGEGRRDTI